MAVDSRVYRVHRAVLFIESRLFEPIKSKDVAAAAGGSLYHLHRLFSEVYGVSIAAYIRNRRLSEAALMLQKTSLNVLHIAMRCQYGSQAAFTRAFTKYFSAAPAAFRRGGGKNYAVVGPATVMELLHRDRLVRYPELIWLHEDRALVGIEAKAQVDNLADFKVQQDMLASYLEDEGCEAIGIAMGVGTQVHFFLGVDPPENPHPELKPGTLSGGLYAVFTHRGPAESVRDSISFFLQAWSPGESMRYASAPCAESFFLNQRHEAELELRLWVPLESITLKPQSEEKENRKN